MKREMITLCYRVTYDEMDKILVLAKSLYPRHKYTAYSLKPMYNGEPTRYAVKYNLTTEEYHKLADEYMKMNSRNRV